MRATTTITGAAVTDAIENALKCLKRNFRTTSGSAGWYHYLDDPTPGVTASAVGLFAFRSGRATFERSAEVAQYLASQQVIGEATLDGGWPVRTTQGFPITEATAWVVRSLAVSSTPLPRGRHVLERGLTWLERNQNTDLGWGSHREQHSRVFTTALAMLALQEGGGDPTVVAGGQKWLIDAQSPGVPAWGPLPGAEPTLLHTSLTLLSLLPIQGSLTANDIRQTRDWIYERLEPGVHTERETIVEEYDVPYPDGGRTVVFQNSLPHFAGPIALCALLVAGCDPLRPKIFEAVDGIVSTQMPNGLWELPRSPLRPSIWATWPFLAALGTFRDVVLPTSQSRATLIFPGCAIVQTEESERPFTRRILVRNAVFDWLRNHKLPVLLWLVAIASVVIPVSLLFFDLLTVENFLLTLVVPVLLVLFQMIWTHRKHPPR